MLRRIGFEYANQIDPFDGGPHFVADTDDITIVKATRQAEVRVVEAQAADAPWTIVAVERSPDVRAAAVFAHSCDDGAIELPKATCALLGVEAGDRVWWVSP